MFPIHDQISTAARSNFESQLAMFTSMSNKVLDSAERLASLNFAAAQTTLTELSQSVQKLCAVHGLQDAFTETAEQSQPAYEKALAYARNVGHIASDAHAKFLETAELQINTSNANVAKLVSDTAKHAPAGSAGMIEVMQVAIETATRGFDQLQRTSRQAGQVIEANINAVMDQIVSAN